MNVNLESFREYLDEYGLTKRSQSSYLSYFKNFCFFSSDNLSKEEAVSYFLNLPSNTMTDWIIHNISTLQNDKLKAANRFGKKNLQNSVSSAFAFLEYLSYLNVAQRPSTGQIIYKSIYVSSIVLRKKRHCLLTQDRTNDNYFSIRTFDYIFSGNHLNPSLNKSYNELINHLIDGIKVMISDDRKFVTMKEVSALVIDDQGYVHAISKGNDYFVYTEKIIKSKSCGYERMRETNIADICISHDIPVNQLFECLDFGGTISELSKLVNAMTYFIKKNNSKTCSKAFDAFVHSPDFQNLSIDYCPSIMKNSLMISTFHECFFHDADEPKECL